MRKRSEKILLRKMEPISSFLFIWSYIDWFRSSRRCCTREACDGQQSAIAAAVSDSPSSNNCHNLPAAIRCHQPDRCSLASLERDQERQIKGGRRGGMNTIKDKTRTTAKDARRRHPNNRCQRPQWWHVCARVCPEYTIYQNLPSWWISCGSWRDKGLSGMSALFSSSSWVCGSAILQET